MRKNIFCVITVVLLLCGALPARAESDNIVKIGGDITVAEGNKIKNAVAVGGQVTVRGIVTGMVLSIGGSVVLTKTALVEGSVVSIGGIIVMGKGARVKGNLREINTSDLSASLASALNEDWEGWSWIFAVLSLLVFVAIFLIALLLVTLLPQPVRLVADTVKDMPFKVVFWGLLALVSVVPLAVLLTISVLGIVLIPLEIFIVVCAALIGFIAVAQVVGEKLFALFKRRDQSVLADIFWGLTILWLVGWIPHIGWMIKVVAVVLGLGGVLAASLSARQMWKKSHAHGEIENGNGTSIS